MEIFPIERIYGQPFMPKPPQSPPPDPTLDPDTENMLNFMYLSHSTPKRGWIRIPTIVYTSDAPPDGVLDIPQYANTPQVLEYCGLDQDFTLRAYDAHRQIVDKESESYSPHHPLVCSAEIIDTALDLLEQEMCGDRYQTAWQKGDWIGALLALGITKEMIRAIMDPRFRKIRQLGTPFHWARDSLSNNYDFLQCLPRRMHRRIAILRQVAKMRCRPYRPSPVIDPTGGNTREYATLYFPIQSHDTDQIPVVQTEAAKRYHIKPGCLRASDQYGPDFGKETMRFFQDEEIARLMAGYMAVRMRSRESSMIYTYTKHEHISPDQNPDILTLEDQDWEDFIWYTRRTEIVPSRFKPKYPPHLRPYRDAHMLAGPICGFADDRIASVDRRDDIFPLRRGDGQPARQIAFKATQAQHQWDTQCWDMTVMKHFFERGSPLGMTFIRREDVCSADWEAAAPHGWNMWRWTKIPFKVEGVEGWDAGETNTKKRRLGDGSGEGGPVAKAGERRWESETTDVSAGPGSGQMTGNTQPPVAESQSLFLPGGFLKLN